jgi:hypothetical protein
VGVRERRDRACVRDGRTATRRHARACIKHASAHACTARGRVCLCQSRTPAHKDIHTRTRTRTHAHTHALQGDRRAASASQAMAEFNLQTKWVPSVCVCVCVCVCDTPCFRIALRAGVRQRPARAAALLAAAQLPLRRTRVADTPPLHVTS